MCSKPHLRAQNRSKCAFRWKKTAEKHIQGPNVLSNSLLSTFQGVLCSATIWPVCSMRGPPFSTGYNLRRELFLLGREVANGRRDLPIKQFLSFPRVRQAGNGRQFPQAFPRACGSWRAVTPADCIRGVVDWRRPLRSLCRAGVVPQKQVVLVVIVFLHWQGTFAFPRLC